MDGDNASWVGLPVGHGLHLGAPLPRLLGGAAVAPRDDFRPRRKPPPAGPCRVGQGAFVYFLRPQGVFVQFVERLFGGG